jgi:hypothetical protein
MSAETDSLRLQASLQGTLVHCQLSSDAIQAAAAIGQLARDQFFDLA